MRLKTFKRGIHPCDKKDSTKDIPVEFVFPRKDSTLIFPTVQHIGAPAVPIVTIGDKVFVGSMLAEAKAEMSSPVFSTVSGEVTEIKEMLTPAGIVCSSIFVNNDGDFKELVMNGAGENYLSFSPDEYIEIIKKAGIVGLGGAGFPTHVKLRPPISEKIDRIIVNAAECEPYLTSDHRVLLEETAVLHRGIKILLRIFKDAEAIVGIEVNKLNALKIMEEEFASTKEISIVPLVPKYPQGAEKQLIYSTTDRVVPSGGLPFSVGCLVFNVDTIIAIERAVVRGRPLMRRIITLSGGAVANPGNYKIKLGTTIRELIEITGGFKSEPYKIIAGGPMMGVSLFNLDVPFTKTVSSLICLTEEEAQLPNENNCIRCSRCVLYCPMKLLPLELNYYALQSDKDGFKKYNGFDCIECGCCSYVCPAKRHLTQSIRAAKRFLK